MVPATTELGAEPPEAQAVELTSDSPFGVTGGFCQGRGVASQDMTCVE